MASKRQIRQKKSGASRKRQKSHRSSASQEENYESSGAMATMVGGFKRAVGVGKPKKRSTVDYVWTIVLLAAVVAVVAWKFF